MLINTVLVFLNNALPAFFLISISAAILKPFSINSKWKYGAVVAGIVGAIVLSSAMSFISQLYQGVGAELIDAMFHFIIFVILLLQIYYFMQADFTEASTANRNLFVLGVAFVITLNGSNLLIYLQGFWASNESINAILIGSILGFGISLSSALLLLYILRSSLLTAWLKIPYVAFIFATARQLSEFSINLIQADWIPSFEPLWNSSNLITDNSELGRFLNALLGYEASPTLTQAIFYNSGIIIPIVIFYLCKKRNPQVRL